MMLTIMLWAVRPVALADGVEWLTPDPEEPEQVEEQSPAAAPEMEWLTPDDAPEAVTPAGVSNPDEPDEPEWLTQDTAPAGEADEETVIDVTVPGSGELVINPHRLPVEMNGETVRDQIVNAGQILTSHSEVPVIVSASLTVNTEQSGGLTVTGQPIASGEREKLGYLYVEFQNLADSEAAADWSGKYTGASNQLLAKDGAASSGEVLQIGAGDGTPAYAAYRLFGELSENPERGWQSGDKLSVTVSFTFRPVEGAEPSPTQIEPDPQTGMEEAQAPDPEAAAIPTSEPVPDYDLDYAPDPEHEPEPEYEPIPEEVPEPEKETVESFAGMSNPDWMLPPG